jgi:hypothetical protein
VERVKDRTARVQLWRELKMTWSYTYECSFYGQDGRHYGVQDYLQCGKDLCLSLDAIVNAGKKENNEE